MRFLMITRPKYMIPRNDMMSLIEAVKAWRIKYAGKLEHIWGFEGTRGGGGITHVNTPEELDEIMAEFPFQGTSEIEIIPLVDVNISPQHAEPFAVMTKAIN